MPAKKHWVSVLREPLLQFLLIGLVLFALDHFFSNSRSDPKQIYIDADRVAWLVGVFQEGQGRLPEPEEIENLIIKWGQNEVFYREAQALGLDQGDEMMRSRLILKMRNILFNRIVQDPPSDEVLKQWFELNREKYDIPERYSFEQFPITELSEIAAQSLAVEIGTNGSPPEYQAQTRRYQRRPIANVKALFGENNAQQLVDSPVGQWRAVTSNKGWHLARITKRHAPIPAQFDEVKTKVSKAFMEISADMQLVEMAGEIADKYQLHREFERDQLPQIIASVESSTGGATRADSRTMKARAGASKDNQVN